MLSLFAHQRPIPDRGKFQVKYVKEYWLGSKIAFFRYAQMENTGVLLEEVVRADEPSPIHFDVEIKQLAGTTEDALATAQRIHGWNSLLMDHLFHLGIPVDRQWVTSLVSAYDHVSTTPFTETECRWGLGIIREHVVSCLGLFVPNMTEQETEIKILTGCRRSKFSLHVLVKNVFCDSAVLTMPLLVFEVARLFVVRNSEWLARQQDVDLLASDEGRFRLRALMLSSMAHTDDNGHRLYRGYNDSPFDEAIYTANHLLRAPGACKDDKTTGALAPVVGEDSPLIVSERRFCHVFPDTRLDEGFFGWVDYLVGGQFSRIGTQVSNPKLLTGWRPSPAYPPTRRWQSEYQNRERDNQRLLLFEVVDFAHATMTYTLYQERRPVYLRQNITRGESRALARRALARNVHNPDARHLVDPDQVFKGEDGIRKAFRMFKSGEFFHHIHNTVEERTPSAKTFPGGFHCFGCNTTFVVERENPVEQPYPFLPEETKQAEDPFARLTTIPWDTFLQKKFCVVSAPMGSGKTEQLISLVDKAKAEEKSVCVVSFRRFLAMDQAKRLDIACYCMLPADQMRDGPDRLTICLNSLCMLGGKSYDIVILDECGLIRRHFLCRTVSKVLWPVYHRFVRLIQDAENVIMMQDVVTQKDVDFYTQLDDVDAEDRTCVKALRFVKPTVIHPIKYTTKLYFALSNLKRCFLESYDQNGVCKQPFMVFCSRVSFAEYLVHFLRELANDIPNADPNRIQGIWSSIRHTDFASRFAQNPNATATETDVIVCTSVVGAGVSVSVHFHSFHAFLFNRILTHNEEQQFIRRLRFQLDHIPEGANRQSYLMVEKGHGQVSEYRKVVQDNEKVMGTLLRNVRQAGGDQPGPSIRHLAHTLARIQVEKRHTFAHHDQLWKDFGDNTQSDFVRMLGEAEEEEAEESADIKRLKKEHANWSKKRKADIARIMIEDNNDDLDESDGMVLYRSLAAMEQEEKFKEVFRLPEVARCLLEHHGTESTEEFQQLLATPSKLMNVFGNVNRLVLWLTYVYRALNQSRNLDLWQRLEGRRYRESSLTQTAVFELAIAILCPMLLWSSHERPTYLWGFGSTPFFSGLMVIQHSSMCIRLKSILEGNQHDSQSVMAGKKKLRSHVSTFLKINDANDSQLTNLYNNPKKAFFFIKKLLAGLGIDLTRTDRRPVVEDNGEEKQPRIYLVKNPVNSLSLALAMKHKLRNPLLELLPTLMGTENLSYGDKAWISDSIGCYNQVCDALSVPQEKYHNHWSRRDVRIGVIPARIEESRHEQEASRVFALVEETPSDRDAQARDREIVDAAYQHVDQQEARAAALYQERQLEAVRSDTIHSDEDLLVTSSQSTQSTQSGHSTQYDDDGPSWGGCPFIDDMANEDFEEPSCHRGGKRPRSHY
jgi:hypothetical protein